MGLFAYFNGDVPRPAAEYPKDLKPLSLADVELEPTQLPSLNLSIGGDERHKITFETVGPDFNLAAHARDLALKLIGEGRANPYEVFDEVKKFVEKERALTE